MRAQALEKPKLTIAVGGKNLLYYLPLTIAEQLGYFKAEGLDVTIVDFAGGARALQAVVGGSADVVSGAFEHTVNMQAKGQPMRAFVLQGRAPQIVLGVNPKTMPNFKTVADLKGKKIGVTAPGSVDQRDGQLRPRQGRAEAERRVDHRRRRGQGAVAAMRAGQIDAISNLDPVITLLAALGRPEDRLRHAHRRRGRQGLRRADAGRLPVRAAALHRQEPGHRAGAGQRDRARRQVDPGRRARPTSIKTVPESYLLGDRAVYIDAFLAAKGALSPDGLIPEAGAETAFRALASIDPRSPRPSST